MLEANYRYKMRHSPDYADVDLPAALSDFRMRIKKYEAAYQPIADRSLHYIKARVRGRGRGWWCVCACVACCAALCAGEAAPPPAGRQWGSPQAFMGRATAAALPLPSTAGPRRQTWRAIPAAGPPPLLSSSPCNRTRA